MNILVTGGAGFIGTNLIKRLVNEGHDVTSIDNYSTGLKSNNQEGCHYKEANIYDFDWRTEMYDVVFHLAAIARIQPSFENPIEYFNTNANGTMQLAEHCAKHNIPCEIYGDGEQRRDFTHVDDIVDALIKIMEKKSFLSKTYELGRGKNISVNEVAKMFEITPIYKNAKPGEARHTLCEPTLAKKVLGWNPQKELLHYIKNLKNENKFYNTK